MKTNFPYSRVAITGASGAIGAALARALAGEGATLYLCGRDEAKLAAVQAACEARGATVIVSVFDVSDRTAAQAWVRETTREKLDLMVVNAGVAHGSDSVGKLESAEGALKLIDINITGAFNVAMPALETMASARHGTLALMSSIAALRGLPQGPSYSASKAALHVWAQGVRSGARASGVQVSCLLPGFIESPMSARVPGIKPGLVSADVAAVRMLSGLMRGRDVVSFPWYLVWAIRSSHLLPNRVVDALLAGHAGNTPLR
jgi:short-subunit dehydrogenase